MPQEQVTNVFLEYGLLGAMFILLLIAVGYLFKLVMRRQDEALAEKGEVVKALVQTAESNTQVAAAVDRNNELIRVLMDRSNSS